MIDMLFLLM